MKISVREFPKKVKPIRDNETYSVHDLSYLKRLVLSMTILHPGKQTKGHSHKGEEEVYMFIGGGGSMLVDKKKFPVKEGDLVLIKAGQFHKVMNPSRKNDFVFVSVFEKYRGRGK